MSEHTPGTEGGANESEPSMEDILASIREVIAKDPMPSAPASVDMSGFADIRDTPRPMIVAGSAVSNPLAADNFDDSIELTIPEIEPEPVSVALPNPKVEAPAMPNALDFAIDEADGLKTDALDLDIDTVISNGAFGDEEVLDLVLPIDEDTLSAPGVPAAALSGTALMGSYAAKSASKSSSASISDEDLLDDVLAEMDGDLIEPSPADSPVLGAMGDNSVFGAMDDDLVLGDDLGLGDDSVLDLGAPAMNAIQAGDGLQVNTAADAMARTFSESDTDLDLDMEIPDFPDAVKDVPIEADTHVDIEALLGDDLVDDLPAPDHVSAPEVSAVMDAGITDAPGGLGSDLSLDDIDIDEKVDTLKDAATLKSREDTDIDLVKSLMADLTDDDFEDDFAQDPETADSNLEAFDLDTDDAAGESIVDDILGAGIKDENALHALESERVSSHSPPKYFSPNIEVPVDDDLAALALEAETEAQMATQRLSNFESAVNDEEVLALATPRSEPIIEMYDTESLEADNENMIAAGLASAAAVAGGAALSNTDAIEEIDYSDADIDVEIHYDIEDTEEEADMAQTKSVSSARVDRSTEVAAGGAFASLAKTVDHKETVYEAGPAIGDMVNEALKPMLKEWLDKNLKDIVEKAVAKEIKRISGGK